ncbi:hypothetical protein M407DRAFT_32595 [Tulasnella calospora MUT 4182]|uniref:Protein kinase domain-containing protein n=1 Tax=Tulasnella calospora MUT 4182 TaxID=1051891 RepID=A0A0C3Q4G6_9AGAM|nr:hypothetical protein M407DRAFT_32595 [Tulasnella calospora MUT 4182]
MAGLSHENIVRFVAFVEDLEHGEAWIIMPWEPNGNINEFLRARKCEIPERISLIKDTFEGIQYLHTRQPPICHGALKSFNILVSSSYRAIITGFGSARVLGLPKPGFSDRWAAPETLNGDCRGLPSDIWSAGWVCWEIMTEKLPFYELKSEAAVLLRVIQGQVPSPSEYEPLSEIVRLCSLMTDCWAFDPRERPIISRCCNEVKWVPSIPPLGGAPSDSKVAGNRLLLQMGRTHYLHARYVPAASLFQQVLDSANSDKGQKEMSEALYWLGTVSAAQCKYPTAEEYYTQAQSSYALIKDDLGRANTLRGLGYIYHLQSKVSEAEQVFTRAQEIYDGVGDDQGRASALCGLGHIYRLRFNYNRAKVVFSQSHEIYARIGDGQGRANTLQGLGTVYHLESRLTEAEEALSGAKKIYARIGDDVGLAEVLVGLGVLDCDRGRYAETESTFTQALEIHSRIGNQRGQADALCGLGNMYLCQSRYMEATSTFKEAKAIYASIGHPSGEADSLHGLGRAYRGRSNYSQARSSYTGAQKLYTRIENDGGRANVLYGLGELNRIESKYDEATSSYTEAQTIYARIGQDERRASTLCILGELHRNKSMYDEATSSYTEAQKIYARIGQDERRADTLCILGEIYRSESKHDEATSSYTEAQKIYTRIGHKVEAAAASEDHGYTWVLQPTDSNAQGTSDETHQIESPENLGQSSDSEIEALRVPSTLAPTNKLTQAGLPEASLSSCSPQLPTTLNSTGNSLSLPSHRIKDDPASSQIASAEDSSPKSNRQEQTLFEEVTAIARTSANEELVDLLQALGKTAPKAVRNKHKIYSVLRIARDICNHIIELGNPPERQIDTNLKTLLRQMEDYCLLRDALERVCRDFTFRDNNLRGRLIFILVARSIRLG